MSAARVWTLASLVIIASWLPVPARAQPTPAGVSKTRVTFKSDNLTLVGFLFKPEGPGPFPGLVWNHGSEKNPGSMRQFDSVAAIFVPAGYVVFAPMRRGHGEEDLLAEQLLRVQRGPLEALGGQAEVDLACL